LNRFRASALVVMLMLVVCPLNAMSADNAMLGQKAQPFQEELLSGGEFDLTPNIGKKVIMLDFWSIYCVSCVQEMPYLAKIASKYPDALLVVGVDLDSFGTNRVKQFVDKLDFKIPYPIVVDKRRKVASMYSVSVLPTTIIIDKTGKISYFHVGYKPGDEVEIENQVKAAAGIK
jgi:cytochrome c biogenesis protein CcmG, thiol:disulfide interchange protein DsbE